MKNDGRKVDWYVLEKLRLTHFSVGNSDWYMEISKVPLKVFHSDI